MLIAAGGMPGWSATAPPGPTVIDFEDYPGACLGGLAPLTDCYRPRGVSIEGGGVVDFSQGPTPQIVVGGAKAIESCSGIDRVCADKISMEFSTGVVGVAMGVGHGDWLRGITSCAPREIVLTAFAGADEVHRDSVPVPVDTCQVIAFFGLARRPGLDGHVRAESPAGAITRVEVGWANPDRTVPVIVDDLEFLPAASQLTITPDRVELGRVAVAGASASGQTTVRNEGDVPMVIRAEITGASPDDFTVRGDCAGRTLDPGASCHLAVTFTATGSGPRTAIVRVITASGTSRTAELVGTGPPAPTAPAFPWAGAGIGLVLAGLTVFGVVLLVRAVRLLATGPRATAAGKPAVPARVWLQPGPVTDTIRPNGPHIAVVVVLDPADGAVTWTARRPS